MLPELKELDKTSLFQKIGDICAIANEEIEEKDLLEISLKKTMELFDANRGSIFIVKENGKDLELKIAQGMQKQEEETLVKRMGKGIVGQVAELKRPIFVNDISKDGRFQNFKARKGYRTASFICAPLMVKDALIGVINITDKESKKNFSKDEMLLLDFVSNQIALNYQRIHLYKKFKIVVKETQELKDKLGQSDQEAKHLKKQIYIHEKLATIGKLAGGIAHEFNNPLDGVMRYTNLCIENMKEDEVVRGYLLEIKQGLNRMANIVQNLLACSRNKFPHKDKVNFSAAVEQALASLKSAVAKKNIVIEKNISKNIPYVQDLGLELILTNLLRNAVDAIDDQGNIIIRGNYENNSLVIHISDTGNGIPCEKVEQIFEPFFTTKDMDKGCGLGLTIVGEIVKTYNGQINVESSPDKGTTFFINIPIES